MATCGLCIASIWISIYQENSANNACATAIGGEVCSETSFGDSMRIVDRRYPNHAEQIDLPDSYGESLVDYVQRYAVVGPYMIAEYQPIGDTGYFWVDLHAGTHDYFEIEGEYINSLNKLGIAQIPVLMPVQAICRTQRCQPCAAHITLGIFDTKQYGQHQHCLYPDRDDIMRFYIRH